MRTLTYTFLATLCLMISPVRAADPVDGLVVVPSPFSVNETLDRLEHVLHKKGISVVARVDHARSGEKVGIPMRPLQLVIFGNPKIGSHIMTASPTAAIDLPMKMIAWKDADGKVWLAYNDPEWIARRHHIADRADTVAKMSKALANLSKAATTP